MKKMLSRSQLASSVFGGVPLEFDPLDRDDLKPHFKGLPKGKPISWGLVVAAVDNSWPSGVKVPGIDWEIWLCPPGEMEIPRVGKSTSGRGRWKTIRQHCALLAVHTGQTDINVARDMGRPAVRALLGLARREFPFLIPSDVLWEGGLTERKKGILGMTASGTRFEAKESAGPELLSRVGLTFTAVSFVKKPAHLHRCLVWLALARSARVRIEAFVHIWLAVLALASYEQPPRAPDMERIRNYTATMGTGEAGGVIAQKTIQSLNDCFGNAYEARNALIHRDDDSLVTSGLVKELEDAVFELVDFELAKAGTPIV